MSDGTVLPSPYGEIYWVISEIIIAFLTFATFYLLLAVILYLLSLNETHGSLRHLLFFCIIAIATASARLISDHAMAFIGWQSDDACKVISSISSAFYTCSIYSAYLLLWYRQKSFYDKPLLKYLLSKRVKWLSYATLVLFAASGLVLIVLVQIPEVSGWNFRATTTGCRDVNDTQDAETLPLLINLVATLAQFALLALLLYPLLTTRKRQELMQSRRIVKRQRAVSSESQEVLVRDALHSAASSDNESVRLQRSPSTRLRHSESDAEESGSQAPTFGSDHEKDDCGRPLTSMERKLDVQKRPSQDSLYEKHQASSIAKTAKDWKNTVCHNETCRRIRRKFETLEHQSEKERKSERKMEKKLKKLIQKVFILAAVCVASDIFFTVVQLRFVAQELVYLAFFDVNLCMNIFCVVLSFSDWKKIITSPLMRQRIATRRRSEGGEANDSFPSATPLQEIPFQQHNHQSPRLASPGVVSTTSTGFSIAASPILEDDTLPDSTLLAPVNAT